VRVSLDLPVQGLTHARLDVIKPMQCDNASGNHPDPRLRGENAAGDAAHCLKDANPRLQDAQPAVKEARRMLVAQQLSLHYQSQAN
jgi:hypothetical protein